jgi:hypothetical protein
MTQHREITLRHSSGDMLINNTVRGEACEHASRRNYADRILERIPALLRMMINVLTVYYQILTATFLPQAQTTFEKRPIAPRPGDGGV